VDKQALYCERLEIGGAAKIAQVDEAGPGCYLSECFTASCTCGHPSDQATESQYHDDTAIQTPAVNDSSSAPDSETPPTATADLGRGYAVGIITNMLCLHPHGTFLIKSVRHAQNVLPKLPFAVALLGAANNGTPDANNKHCPHAGAL
jgi:hypothetical protein